MIIIPQYASQSYSFSSGNRVDLPEIFFINIRKSGFGVLFDFYIVRCEDLSVSFSFPITLVSAAHSVDKITLLSSKGNGNRVDIHKILFITIRTTEFGVLFDFNMLRY